MVRVKIRSPLIRAISFTVTRPRPALRAGALLLLSGMALATAAAPLRTPAFSPGAAAARAGPAGTRRAFLKLVAPRKAELAPEVTVLGRTPDLVREKVILTSEPGQRVAMLILRPNDPRPRRRPAVVLLHGTRGKKEALESWLKELAGRGFVACATDARWHGELARGPYEEAIIRAYRTGKGHPWLYETVTDTIRVLDYLQTRKDVDGGRIGMLGISMGGMNTWLTAAADPRVKVAVPCIGVTSFAYQLETGTFGPRAATLPRFHRAVAEALGEKEVNARVVREAWSRLLPGILDRFDCPRMLEAIAPRPLLILNGEKDDRCPIEGVRRCYAAAEAAYRRAGVLDRLKMIVAPDTGHEVTPGQRAAALEWLARWLQPSERPRQAALAVPMNGGGQCRPEPRERRSDDGAPVPGGPLPRRQGPAFPAVPGTDRRRTCPVKVGLPNGRESARRHHTRHPRDWGCRA